MYKTVVLSLNLWYSVLNFFKSDSLNNRTLTRPRKNRRNRLPVIGLIRRTFSIWFRDALHCSISARVWGSSVVDSLWCFFNSLMIVVNSFLPSLSNCNALARTDAISRFKWWKWAHFSRAWLTVDSKASRSFWNSSMFLSKRNKVYTPRRCFVGRRGGVQGVGGLTGSTRWWWTSSSFLTWRWWTWRAFPWPLLSIIYRDSKIQGK